MASWVSCLPSVASARLPLVGPELRAQSARAPSGKAIDPIGSDHKTTILTSKCLLNVDHFSRTGLHEAVSSTSCPVQTFGGTDLPYPLQITLVTSDNADRQHFPSLHASFALLLDELVEPFERAQRGLLSDVVDEQEGIGVQVGRRPQTAVFFLAGGVCDCQGEGGPVNVSRDRVRVFDGRIVPALHQASALVL